MSARQPFLPSRPASRTVNPSEETGATPTNVAPAVLNKTSDNNHLEVGVTGSIRALNISGLRKSSRTPNLSAIVNPGTLHNQIQNQGLSGGTHSRSDTKSSATRIYAPLPSTPPAVLPQPQCPVFGLPTPEFKTPLLPFSKSFDETAAGRGSVEAITRSPASNSDGAALNLFRPMSCHPQDEIGAQGRRPTSHQSFFGSARLSFDSVSSHLDDSGYYSSVSEQNDNEGDQPIPVNRSNAVCPSAGGDDVQGPRNVNDFDANLPHPTKRIRPASPDDREDVSGSRQRELSKRPRVRHSPLHSHSPPQGTTLGNASSGGTQTFLFPPNVPHNMVTLGDIPGLEFSGADLERYAELYEKGAECWSRSTMEEWLAGANDIMAKFSDLLDIIKEHMSSKVNLYRSLHTKLADEYNSLEQRTTELRDASQALVRDTGNIGGGLDSNNLSDHPYES